MLETHSFAFPQTPSTPEQDLQEISMYDDFHFYEDNRNAEASPLQPPLIQGWIKPQKKLSQGSSLELFKSKILREQHRPPFRKNVSQCMTRHRKTASLSLGVNRDSEQARPKTNRSQLRKVCSNRWELDGKSRDPIHLTGFSFHIKTHSNKTKNERNQSRQEKKQNPPRSARNMVSFPLFSESQLLERPPMKATAVGKIRTLMKNKMRNKQ